MEADLSILRKTGHFYFALTAGSVPFWTARVMLSCDGGFPIPQGVTMQCEYDLFEVLQTVVNSRFCRALQCEDPVH
jgi:hypothetical protein